jgi:hypothetical protein
MDIVNIDALKAQGRILDAADVDPNEDYFVLGKYTNKYTTDSFKYTKYPVWAIKAGDVMGIPTLQQVLDFNHDLLSGNNYQGTGAGDGNTGVQVLALGRNAANLNTGSDVNTIGLNSAQQNTGSFVNAIGRSAAFQNIGSSVNAIGVNAAFRNEGNTISAIGDSSAQENRGDVVIAIGANAARENQGAYVNAIGDNAANLNQGNNVIAIGTATALQNIANNVIALGTNAGSNNNLAQSVIISNSELPTYADHTAALVGISVATGATTGTYLYHNQATNSIGAVRIP